MDAGPSQGHTGVHKVENNDHNLMHPVCRNRHIQYLVMNYFAKNIFPHADFRDLAHNLKFRH